MSVVSFVGRFVVKLFASVAVVALLLAGCADDPAVAPDDQDDEVGAADPQDVEPAGDAEQEPVDLPDRPQAYSVLYVEQEPGGEQVDGEVSVTFGRQARSTIPFVVHNGTDEPISRVEVSGRIVDAGGETLTSGRSQTIHPNVVMPGGFAVGYVFADGDELPDGVEVADPAVDFTAGLGEFENIVEIDVDEVTQTGGGFTGQVSNPHEIDVTGPVDVMVACLTEGGELDAVFSTYTDRDDIDAGDASTFTVDRYGDEADCASLIVGSSGYTDDF
jgi:hypothetical protein